MKNFLLSLLLNFPLLSLASENSFDTWQHSNSLCNLLLEKEPIEVWSGEGEPPITISKAQSIFNTWKTTNLPKDEEGHPVSYNLASIRTEESSTNHWIYKVGFVVFRQGAPAANLNRKIAVTMDGKVIVPICENL
jgi:hypothetical protein